MVKLSVVSINLLLKFVDAVERLSTFSVFLSVPIEPNGTVVVLGVLLAIAVTVNIVVITVLILMIRAKQQRKHAQQPKQAR